MNSAVERARRFGSPGRQGLRLGLLALALAATLGPVGLWWTGPSFHLWVNGEPVAEAADAAALQEALTGWAAEATERSVTLEHEGQTWSYRLAELGLTVPLETGRAQIAEAIDRRAWWQRRVEVRLELPADSHSPSLEAALAPVRAAVERAPTPASLEAAGEQVSVIPAVDGLSVDSAAIRAALRDLGKVERIRLPVMANPPELTTAAVQGLGIRRLIAEWSTHYDPAIPRAENVERAARAFDGLILKPGEILSYNGTVGPVDASTGWREASVILGGELVPGVGGGVCQVATTFYGAALRANMEILERHPHQLAVGYIPPSEDAAVAQGYQDLKIRNNTRGHVLVRSEADGGTVTFRLYGDLPSGQEIRIESEVTGSLPFPVRAVVDPALAPGQQQPVRGGIPGLTSEAYRLVFADGELVKRELLSRDQYLPTAAVVHTGPAEGSESGGSD